MSATTERLLVELPADLVAALRQTVRSGAFASEGEVIAAVFGACFGDQSVSEKEIEEVRARVAEGLADVQAGRLVDADDLHDRLQARYRAMRPDE
jgi:Arc/MetJ-type ribon-helix-helix transcriptional regulator